MDRLRVHLNIILFEILFRCYYYAWITQSAPAATVSETSSETDSCIAAPLADAEDSSLPKELSLKEQMEQVMKDSLASTSFVVQDQQRNVEKNYDELNQGGDAALYEHWQPRSLSAEGIQLFDVNSSNISGGRTCLLCSRCTLH